MFSRNQKWLAMAKFVDHTQRRVTVGRTPSRRVISSSRRPLPDNTQHSQQKNVHAPSGIRTHNPSRRAPADLRLRPIGHWDRRISLKIKIQFFRDATLCRQGKEFPTFRRNVVCSSTPSGSPRTVFLPLKMKGPKIVRSPGYYLAVGTAWNSRKLDTRSQTACEGEKSRLTRQCVV